MGGDERVARGRRGDWEPAPWDVESSFIEEGGSRGGAGGREMAIRAINAINGVGVHLQQSGGEEEGETYIYDHGGEGHKSWGIRRARQVR